MVNEWFNSEMTTAQIRRGIAQTYVDALGLTQAATRFGIPARQLADMLAERKSFGEKVARKMELRYAPDRDSGWLDTPSGAYGGLPGEISSDSVIGSMAVIQNDTKDIVIREYETGGSMGWGLLLAEQPGVIKEWRVSERWAQENVHRVTSYKNLKIVTGFGPSMQPLFNPGDPLLVDCGITRADVDGVYFFRVGDEGFVKQLQRIPTIGGLILRAKSYNTLYDSFDIIEGMDFEVFARVVKIWKGEEF